MTDIVFFDGDNLIPLVVDAVVEEQHRASSIATEDEVELGVTVSDHVKAQRRTLLLRCVISDTPLGPGGAIGGSDQPVELELPRRQIQAQSQNGAPGAITDDSPSMTFGVVFMADAAPTRIADSWRILSDARERSLLCIVSTALDTYDDMALLGVEVVRTALDRTWIQVDLTFAEIRQVATQLVNDPVPARVRDRRQVNRGAQAATPVPTTTAPRLRSDLVQLLGAL